MSGEFNDILEDPGARSELESVARMLQSARPLPSPAFRGELGRRLRANPGAPRSRRLRLQILGMGAAGVLALILAGLGVAHEGPLAPSRAAAAPVASTPP